MILDPLCEGKQTAVATVAMASQQISGPWTLGHPPLPLTIHHLEKDIYQDATKLMPCYVRLEQLAAREVNPEGRSELLVQWTMTPKHFI